METVRQELMRLSESGRKAFVEKLSEPQRASIERQIAREDLEGGIQVFEALGIPHEGAVAAAKGRQERQPVELPPLKVSERQRMLELPNKSIKLSEASAAELQVAEAFAKQRAEESIEVFMGLGMDRKAATFAAQGRY